MRFGVVVFPGSNCDHDCYYVIKEILKQPVEFIWHGARGATKVDCYVLPGGFSYGDYLRTGAIARFSPVMSLVKQHAKQGRPVVGICNGFQILLEAGLLPGAMLRNRQLTFVCKYVHIRVESQKTPFTRQLGKGRILRIPVAHGEGNYYCDAKTLAQLKARNQIVFRYCTATGELSEEANPNGSLENIAGICNPSGNVLGLMPHPERCMESEMGSRAGQELFLSLLLTAQSMVC